MTWPVDYCPHCCCEHVIGEHPRDGETESAYWQRMAVLMADYDAAGESQIQGGLE